MFISPTEVLAILEQYKYFVIFPIVIFEGPIITIISGFLIYLGVLNPYFTYALLIIGDLIGDSLYYSIGRFWGRSLWIKKLAPVLGFKENSVGTIENHFKKHLYKTLFIAKFSHGMGGTIQASSGMARVNFGQYLWINFVGITIKTLILLVIGFYLGESYIKIDGYLHYIAFFTISLALLIILYFVSRKYVRNFVNKGDKADG